MDALALSRRAVDIWIFVVRDGRTGVIVTYHSHQVHTFSSIVSGS
jgi:hypothetical protein